jgi:hypothetical protein
MKTILDEQGNDRAINHVLKAAKASTGAAKIGINSKNMATCRRSVLRFSSTGELTMQKMIGVVTKAL